MNKCNHIFQYDLTFNFNCFSLDLEGASQRFPHGFNLRKTCVLVSSYLIEWLHTMHFVKSISLSEYVYQLLNMGACIVIHTQ